MKLAACLLVLALYEPAAHAIAACGGSSGWAAEGAEVPPNAHLVFWSERADLSNLKITAKLDGKPVTAKVTSTMKSAPYSFALVDIQSSGTGSLELTAPYTNPVTFKVAAKHPWAKAAHATVSHFVNSIRHSTVKENYDALAVKVDVPAIRAHVKLRRDAKASWFAVDVPVDGNQTFLIGQLGCYKNYETELLEDGADIEVQLTLADGSTLGVENFTHTQLPPT